MRNFALADISTSCSLFDHQQKRVFLCSQKVCKKGLRKLWTSCMQHEDEKEESHVVKRVQLFKIDKPSN